MAKDRDAQNENPSFETIRTRSRVTDLLKADVCPPLWCGPQYPSICVPEWTRIGGCHPDICRPKYLSATIISERLRIFRERSRLRSIAEEYTSEIKEMTKELRKIRVEIENLKKKIK